MRSRRRFSMSGFRSCPGGGRGKVSPNPGLTGLNWAKLGLTGPGGKAGGATRGANWEGVDWTGPNWARAEANQGRS